MPSSPHWNGYEWFTFVDTSSKHIRILRCLIGDSTILHILLSQQVLSMLNWSQLHLAHLGASQGQDSCINFLKLNI